MKSSNLRAACGLFVLMVGALVGGEAQAQFVWDGTVTLRVQFYPIGQSSPSEDKTQTFSVGNGGSGSLTASGSGGSITISVSPYGSAAPSFPHGWLASVSATDGWTFGGNSPSSSYGYHDLGNGARTYYSWNANGSYSAPPPSSYNGPTWYVRASGNDNNDGSSPSKAFATLAKAMTKAGAGHKVYIGAGTYAGTHNAGTAGTSSSPIEYVGDPTGAFTGDAGLVQIGPVTATRGHISISNLWFYTGLGLHTSGSGPNVTVSTCTFRGTDRGVQCAAGSGVVTLQSCLFDAADDPSTQWGVSALAGNVNVYDCQFTGGRYALRAEGDNGSAVFDVQRCKFSNQVTAFLLAPSSPNNRVTVKRCEVYGSAPISGAPASMVNMGSGAATFENCLLYANDNWGIGIGAGTLSVNHCTIANRKHHLTGAINREGGTVSVTNSVVTGFEVAYPTDAGITRSHNLYVNCDRTGPDNRLLTGEMTSTPQFIGAGESPFRLLPDADGVDSGTAGATIDLTGIARPQGGAVDLGCYESAAEATKTYFVKTNGNDSNTGRSPGRAFRTLAKAASVVNPGDLVYVGGGTYRERTTFSRSGVDGSPIRFIADTSGAKTGVAGPVKISSQEHGGWTFHVYADQLSFVGFTFTGEEMTYANDGTNKVYNYPYGVYVNRANGTATFENCTFTGLCYGLHSNWTGVKVIGCTFRDNIWYSVHACYGGLIIDNCDFTGRGNGPVCYRNHFTQVKNSRITGMSDSSLVIAFDPYGNHKPFGENTPEIENCRIEDNQYGLNLQYAKTSDTVRFVNTVIKNPKSWQILLYYSDIDMTPDWLARWPIAVAEKTHYIHTHKNKLRVSNVTIEGFPGHAFYSHTDELTINRFTSRNNGRGLDVYYPINGQLTDVRVVEATGWGLHVLLTPENRAALTNCVIEKNVHGAYFSRATDANLQVVNATIANNSGQGVQFSECEVELSPRTMGTRWKLSNNGYGVVSYYSKMLLDGITFENCATWGAVLHYGEATVRNCNFLRNGNGLYLYHNRQDQAVNCHFDDNAGHGLALASNGTYYGYDATAEEPAWKWMDTPHSTQIQDCTVDRNQYGVYIYRTLPDKLRIDQTPIRDNRAAGVYANYSEFTFNPATMSRLFDVQGNASYIYAGSGKYTFEGLEIKGVPSYGIHTWYSDVTLRNCRFQDNPHIAYYSYFDRSVQARNCDFQRNGWGYYAYADRRYHNGGQFPGDTGWRIDGIPHQIVNCDISRNTHGMGLLYSKDDSIEIVNSPIHDNTHYGLYTVHGEMTFDPASMERNWTLTDNGYHIVAGYGKYTFNDLTFADAKIGGVSTHYGDVSVKNCRFKGNTNYGFQSYYNRTFVMENCEITENRYLHANGQYYGTGMHLAHGKYWGNDDGQGWRWYETDTVAVVKNTPIRDNGSYGMQIGWGRDDNIQIIDSPISGHRTGAGIYASNCQFAFTPRTMGTKWQLSDNAAHIYASWGKYLFEDLTLTGATSYGAATWGSEVTVRNCKFNDNGSYGFHSHYDTLLVENCEFNNNEWAGITLRNTHPDAAIGGPMTIRNSTISGNHVGIYAPYCRTDVNPIKLEGTPIEGNRGWGVYFNTSEIDFKPGSFVMEWQLRDNGNNFLIYHGKTRFEGVEMADAKGWAAYTAYGDVVAKNVQFRNNGNGLYLHSNSQSIVEDCKFLDNTGWGVWTRPYYGYDSTNSDGSPRRVEYKGPVRLTNVESLRNGYGLGVYDYSVVRGDELQLANMTIQDSTSWGLMMYYIQGELNTETFQQFDRSLKNNANGVYLAYSTNVTVKGLTITGNTGWGLHAYECNGLKLSETSVSGNGSGFYWYPGWWNEAMKDYTLDVDNCHFDNNRNGQGLLTYWGRTTAKNCTFNNNSDGYYTAYNTLSQVENCEMKGNTRWGVVLHVNYAMWNDGWLDERRSWYQDNHQTLKQCAIDGNGHGLIVYNAGNEHFQMADVQITNCDAGHGLYFSECRYVWDSQVRDRVVLKGMTYGISATGSAQGDVTIRDAVVEDCAYMGLYNSGSKLRAENVRVKGGLYGVYWYRPKRMEITNCRFDGSRQSDWGWAAHGYGGPTSSDTSVVKLVGNVFDKYRNGLYTYVYGDESYVPEIMAYNNTFANLGYWGAYADRGSSPVVKNNIFARMPGDTGGYGLGQNRGTNGQLGHSHNLLSGFAAPFYDGVSDSAGTTVQKSPRFLDMAGGDFHLAAGSPAINAGTNSLIGEVGSDVDGNSRPLFAVVDMGAYETPNQASSLRVLDWAEAK